MRLFAGGKSVEGGACLQKRGALVWLDGTQVGGQAVCTWAANRQLGRGCMQKRATSMVGWYTGWRVGSVCRWVGNWAEVVW